MNRQTFVHCTFVVLAGASHAAPASSQLTVHEGITAAFAYTSDFVTNVSGGAKRGSVYLGNVDLMAAFESGTLWGWEGATAFLCPGEPRGFPKRPGR